MPNKPQDKADDDKEQRRASAQSYMKYSGMAFQMGGIILFGVFIGKKLDAWLHTEPYLLAVMALLSTFAALYIVLKDLL